MDTQRIELNAHGRLQRIWRGIKQRRGSTESAVTPMADSAARSLVPAVDIAPDDPLIAYFQRHPNVAEIDRLTLDSGALEELRAAGVKLVVPLVSQGELVGLINLGPRLSEQDYSSDDRTLLDNLAGQAAPALRVAQMVRQQQAELQARERIEQQLRLARVIQQTLLPKQVPDLAGWQIAAYYQPAWEVGGDFYDFIYFPDGRIGVVVGDVTDKGVPSALVMATTRSILRTAAEQLIAPGEVLQRVNDMLCGDIPPNMFVTCLYLLLDPPTGRVRYANAGHDLPYRRAGDQIDELRATGMPLGLMTGMSYEERETTLSCGDTVLLYSDGLAEAHNPRHEMLGFPRVKTFMLEQPSGSRLIDHLLDCLGDFTGPEWVQEDDVTLVTLTRVENGGRLQSSRNAEDEEGWRLVGEYSVPSAPGNEREAIALVEQAVRDLNLPPRRLERLKTAVGEATMNAMEHGNHYRTDLPTRIEVRVSERAVSVRVIDNGGDHPIIAQDAPNLEAKLAGQQSPRGWGVFLIRHMVDDVKITTDGVHHTIELILSREGDGDADASV